VGGVGVGVLGCWGENWGGGATFVNYISIDEIYVSFFSTLGWGAASLFAQPLDVI